MKLAALLSALLAFALSSCGGDARGQSEPTHFQIGFWFWGGFDEPAPSAVTPAVVYARAGSISAPESSPLDVRRMQWRAYAELPPHLPPAQTYWLVIRYENQGVPDPAITKPLLDSIRKLWGQASLRHLSVAGIQLDIDSPTGSLAAYADFLRGVRAGLPEGCQFSITALLDWFRPGTDVASVVQQVDEFVPQFYDVSTTDFAFRTAAIAAKFDPARWGPRFNSFGKRFHIGISTFGRARAIKGEQSSPYLPYHNMRFGLDYVDLTPLDIGLNPAFQLTPHRNEAGELILDYKALRDPQIQEGNIQAGDSIEFIVATPESVRASVNAARKIGGYCAGVILFRWPEFNETLALQPEEALAAAGALPAASEPVHVELVDASCAAVHCADLFLVNAKPWAERQQRYRLSASAPLEYFLPDLKSLVHPAGPSQLEVLLPPYTGRGRIFLGRAVSRQPIAFQVEEQ
jgi:hypothetical protein